jgi:hypothetical protein
VNVLKAPCILGALAAVAAAGCRSTNLDRDTMLNTYLVRTVQDAGMRHAIITQHTLYDYHFVPGGGALNDLGFHDLAVLAEHYRLYPGDLHVRGGGERPAVREARLETVRAFLVREGVEMERVVIADGLPGGEGMSSERLVRVLAAEAARQDRGGGSGGGAAGAGGAAARTGGGTGGGRRG